MFRPGSDHRVGPRVAAVAGRPLPDLRRNGLEHPEGVRLRQLRARAVEDLAVRELRIGAVEDAASRLLALLSAEPLRERACGYAMWALHRLGMTADAVTCYDQLVERLEDELGAKSRAPNCDRPIVPSRVETTPSDRPTDRIPLVGRGHELARLSTMLDRERMVTVTGPAGCGKTRLVSAALSTTDVPVTLIPLSTCDDFGLYEKVAAAVGLHSRGPDEGTDDLPMVLTEYLRGRRHILVFDGCEHLLRPYATRAAGSGPGVRMSPWWRRTGQAGPRGSAGAPLGSLARDGVRDPSLSWAGKLPSTAPRVRRASPRPRRCPPCAGPAAPSGRPAVRRWNCCRSSAPGTTPTSATVVRPSCRMSYQRLWSRRELLGAFTVFDGDVDPSATDP